MWMTRLAGVAPLLALGACATLTESPKLASGAAPCETVQASVVMSSREQAIHHARLRAGEEALDTRGDFMEQGARAVIKAAGESCRPYRLFGADTGLLECTVTKRVCQR